MSRSAMLALHLLLLAVLVLALVALATWRGQLWPFEPRFSALMAARGLMLLIAGWGAGVWLAPVILAALLRRPRHRVLIWPAAVAAMVGAHALFGPVLGFMPLERLTIAGAIGLYAVPLALALVLGSALGETVRAALPSGSR